LYEIEYYEESCLFPVIDFIRELNTKEKAKILREINLLKEFGFSLGMPYIRKMEGIDKLWELRIKQGSNSFRVFYFHYEGGKFVLVHGIKKKSEKTPGIELNIAVKRMKKYYQRKEK